MTVGNRFCIDDQVDTCALVAATLPDWDVVAAYTAWEGLRLSAAENFSLILVDYYLPDETGLELCEKIRAFDVETPIVVFTATHSVAHDDALRVGAQGVMRKEHLVTLLPAALANALEVRLMTDTAAVNSVP